jgi:hypothetical protein
MQRIFIVDIMGFFRRFWDWFVPEKLTPCSHCTAWTFDESGHKVCRKSEEYWQKILDKQAEERLLEEEAKKLGEEL